jgi:cell division protein FtsB
MAGGDLRMRTKVSYSKPASKLTRELCIMVVLCLAIYHAGRSIYDSIERQVFLNWQAQALKKGQRQAEEINADLREGLTNYRSSSGIERLARERLNLAGHDEIMLRIGK